MLIPCKFLLSKSVLSIAGAIYDLSYCFVEVKVEIPANGTVLRLVSRRALLVVGVWSWVCCFCP